MSIRIIVAPDSYKGTLTAAEAATAIEEGLRATWPRIDVEAVPLGDGGDGTVEALNAALDGRWFEAEVRDPLGAPVLARYGLLPDGTALVDMASASGLILVPENRRNPYCTSTYGTGQLLLAAGDRSHHVVMGIGGSATVDCGVGMARAMGARFLDAQGEEVRGGPGEFPRIREVDFGETARRWRREVRLEIMSDVDNPLVGSRGAARVFGPQKGARPEDVPGLDRALSHLGELLSIEADRDVRKIPGAGAAGGMGAMLVAMLGARLLPGAELALDLVRFDERLPGCDLVVTGEGRLDAQTLSGKLPLVVAQRARRWDVPVAVLPGSLEPGSQAQLAERFDYIEPCFEVGKCEGSPGRVRARVALVAASSRLATRIRGGEAHSTRR